MTHYATSGQGIAFDPSRHDLSLVTVGIGWKTAAPARTWWRRLVGPDREGLDLDAMAILLDANGKIRNFGVERDLGGGRRIGLVESDVVFHNNLQHPSGAIWHTGDDLRGGTGGDNEQIIVKLQEMPASYHRILFIVCIHQGQLRNQHFGMVKNAYMRAVDARGREIGRYPLSANPDFDGKCTLIFGELSRQDAGWTLHPIGKGLPSDSFVEVLRQHV